MEQLNNAPAAAPAPETKSTQVSGINKNLAILFIVIAICLTGTAVFLFMNAVLAKLNVELTSVQTQLASLKEQNQKLKNPPQAQNEDVMAQNVEVIEPNEIFTLADYPSVKFKIQKVYKAWGAISNSNCYNSKKGIFIKNMQPSSPSGTCIDAEYKVENQPVAAIVVDFVTINNSDKYAISRFLRLSYDITEYNELNQRYASENPPWDSYGSDKYSSNSIRLGFMVPENQDNFTLQFGHFGRASGNYYDTPSVIGTEGEYKINFSNKTFIKSPKVQINVK